ncbi:MAG: HAMP domain-containing protein [Acidobacteriota bacterium]|nr:MAG: HAMP domain-containing protein [Acidobacteriota bacterium]
MISSIRVKLTLFYICVLAFIVGAFALITYSSFVSVLRQETDENLTEMAQTLSASIKAEQNDGETLRKPDEIVIESLGEFRFRDYQFAVFTNDDRFIASTTENKLPSDLSSIDKEKFGDVSIKGTLFRTYVLPFHVENHNYKLYVFHSLEDEIALDARIRRTFYLIAPLLLLFAGLGGYFLVGESLRPIAAIGDRAKQISAANLHERLPIANAKDEIGNLAIVFNELLDRLDVEFDRQRRFMADASHELRTPLAIIRGESEVALSKDSRSSTDYQESLQVVNDESKRLSKIVEDLFTLARADSGQLKANLDNLYLDELVSDCVRLIRTLADKRNSTIEFEGKETQIKGDEALLRRLFLNLLDNAVKYNHDGGSIKINVAANRVTISNTGDEIPEDQQKSIFDRFYRVEKSRTQLNDTMMSGAGLGLSIAKHITELHNAELKYSRSDNGENIFLITFPR